MNFGILISLALHSAVLLGGFIAFKADVKPFEETKIIPIAMVTIDEITNIKAAIKSPKPKAVEKIEPEPEVMTLETPMKNAEDEGELQERVEAVVPEEIKVAEILPELVEDAIEVPETPTQPEAEEPQEVDLDRLSGLINRVREQAPERNQQRTLQSETNSYVFADIARAGVGEANSMSVSELDALQSAMYKCWSVPAAAPNPSELIVPVKVSLFPDGYVNQVKLGSFREINHFHKLAADEAIRAVNKCQPYDFLPAEKYSHWREMTLNFRPDV